MKISLSLFSYALLCVFTPMVAQDTRYSPEGQQIPAPSCLTQTSWDGGYTHCSEQAHQEWLKDVTHWRNERRIRIGYDSSRYEMPALKWTQSSFIQPQMMVHDRFLYDPVGGKYTVDRYLEDLQQRYGGIDAVLVWATYPNMGLDTRNQDEMVRSMPGGVAGVRQMVADFHRRGVRVFFPIMMWDQGTADPGAGWPQRTAELMKELDADGINGDTQDGVPLAFSLASEKLGHPLAFEPENAPHDEGLAWNVMTWGQYKFQFVPTVDRFRWLETRHQVNISDRWNRDKTDDLQFAFFNGEGWESWENIWGIWNGISPRDQEATRRVALIERAIAPFLVSPGWEPYYSTRRYGVFASRWPNGKETVWTIVNRNEYGVTGQQMAVPRQPGTRFFDLYHGVELTPEVEGQNSVLTFSMEGHGYGAILATTGEPGAPVRKLLGDMKQITRIPLASLSHEWKQLPQQLVEIAPTATAKSVPVDMVKIAGGSFPFKVDGIEIEGSNDIGVDIQYPWEPDVRRFHEHQLEMKPFYLDKYPVTNAQFKSFVDAARYHPNDSLNFLKDWRNGNYPYGWEKKPVTWVSLEDARAYAAWAGKRLPHEWEWQFAAQGMDGRAYPWGNAWEPKAVPTPDQGRTMRGPDDVDAHPTGSGPSGAMDLVGNVWQWTDEYTDEHTRSAILRGGSYYQPQGSMWYFPQAYRNDQHGKLLLMAPSYDRSGAIGFRCAKDAH